MSSYLIETRGRLIGTGWAVLILASILWLLVVPVAAHGLQAGKGLIDTTDTGVDTVTVDTVIVSAETLDTLIKQPAIANRVKSGPPISPKRAFFTSLLLPGYAQARLDRQTSSMIYAVFEIISIGMLSKSAQDLRSAKRLGGDSVIIGYQAGAGGEMLPVYGEPRINTERIKARKLHYEDWIAALAFNHLISAADAYVAAYLWDFKANLEVQSSPTGARTARVGFSRSF